MLKESRKTDVRKKIKKNEFYSTQQKNWIKSNQRFTKAKQQQQQQQQQQLSTDQQCGWRVHGRHGQEDALSTGYLRRWLRNTVTSLRRGKIQG